MALLKKQTTPVDDLHQQRVDLVKRLAEAQAIMQNADPVVNWEKVSKATADVMALERALVEVDKRIAGAEREQRQASAQAADEAAYTRKLAAIAGLRSEARAVTAIIQHLDAGAFKALDAAYDEAAAAGALPVLDVGPVLELRLRAASMIAALRDLDPVLVGEAPRPTAAELRIAEARRAVETAEATLAEVSRISYGGEGRALAIERAGDGLRLAQKRLSALTGESYTVAALQSRIARMVSTVPMRQPDEVFP